MKLSLAQEKENTSIGRRLLEPKQEETLFTLLDKTHPLRTKELQSLMSQAWQHTSELKNQCSTIKPSAGNREPSPYSHPEL